MNQETSNGEGQRLLPGAPCSATAASRDVAIRLRDTELYVDACDEAADLIEHAETLLCNSKPMSHCTQADWDKLIKDWRDRKHGVSPNVQNSATAEL